MGQFYPSKNDQASRTLEVAGKEQILRYFSHSAVLDCPLPVGLYYVTARIRDRLGQTAET